jgi:glycerol-3-phosphate dehydrogenase (NAD(P)+)
MDQVAEGVKTVRSVMDIAREPDVRMPISLEVEAVCNEGRPAATAYRGLSREIAQHERYPGL